MPSARRGFTLIELVVVMGIVLVLMGIMIPATGRVWDSANATRCQSNVRTLTGAFLAFARDNDSHLPGTLNSYAADRIPAHWDWLFGAYSTWQSYINPTTGLNYTTVQRLECAPQNGTIWKYVNSYQTYLCPSLTVELPGVGVGSNGRFDYAAFSIFCGAKLSDIGAVSDLQFAMDPNNPSLQLATQKPFSSYGLSSYSEKRPTPIICQEEALINIQANDLEGQHCNTDQMSHVHGGGSWYGSIDGGCYFVKEPDTDPTNLGNEGCRLWWQAGPISGQLCALDGDPGGNTDGNGNATGWGAWSHQ